MAFGFAVQRLHDADPINSGLLNDLDAIALESSLSWWKDNLLNYGCYCWPGGNALAGGGTPVDELDNTCFQHKQCQRCVSLQAGCEKVNWETSDYGIKFATSKEGNVDVKCTDMDPCLQAMCECDKDFALQVGGALTTRNSAYFGSFLDHCVQGPAPEDLACCGDWPNVRAFSPELGKCCDEGLRVQEVGVGVGFQCDHQDIKPGFSDFFRTLSLNR